MWGRVYLKPRHNCVPNKHFLLTVSSFQQKYRVGFLHPLPLRLLNHNWGRIFCPFDSHGTCKFIYRLNKPMVSRIVGLFNIRFILFFGQQDFSRFKPYSAEGQALLLHKSQPIKKNLFATILSLETVNKGLVVFLDCSADIFWQFKKSFNHYYAVRKL